MSRVEQIEKLRWLTPAQADKIASRFGTPTYVYNQQVLIEQAQKALSMPAPFGLTVRYAMKANSNRALLALFNRLGLYIDASSGYEVERAVLAGFEAKKILLTSQELPPNLESLIGQGMLFNATSLYQLRAYGELFPGTKVSVRINPGLAGGGHLKTNVGGATSSFGIWHDYIDEIYKITNRYKLSIERVHIHVGSGTDPKAWGQITAAALNLARRFTEASIINIGGGFKVARTSSERGVNLEAAGTVLSHLLKEFAQATGRRLHLEIEPGTFLVANAGVIVASVIDIVDTSKSGFKFLKLNTGMTEILRPMLYSAQHPIIVVNAAKSTANYVVVGHACESGDLLTPMPGNSGHILTRRLHQARVGDLVVIEGAGASCSSMSAANYNSFPLAAEVMIERTGRFKLIRRRQTLAEMLALEQA